MASTEDRRKLMDYFGEVYLRNTRRPLIINRAISKWSAGDLVDSYGMSNCKALVDRYIMTSPSPTWDDFVYKSDSIFRTILIEKQDKAQRKVLKANAERWIRDNAK